MASPSLYWHDYEAGGINPRLDRPMQFAGIRTDLDLNILGKPLSLYCQLPADYLPHPQACLITGIAPQTANRLGVVECEFARQIHEQFQQAGSTIVGYNNIRYDDEMSRFLFYRNFYDPYAYSYEQQNSRWDLLTLVRAAYALRPDGLEWPQNENGEVSLKLDRLAPANGIEHSNAHDALADVYASIELAKKIKQQQPKLYDYTFSIRSKKALIELAKQALVKQAMLVHVSGFFGASQHYVRWVFPLAFHPENPNQLIVWRLDCNPEQWRNESAETIRELCFTASTELTGERPGLMAITLNQCPFLAPEKTLSPERAATAGIDIAAVQQHYQALLADNALREHLLSAFTHPAAHQDNAETKSIDADLALYSQFLSPQARTHAQMIRAANPEALASINLPWDDPRLPVLLFRYRARNFPHTLSPAETHRWQQHCQNRLFYGEDGYLSADEYMLAIEQLVEQYANDQQKMAMLKQLTQYVTST